MHLLDVKNSSHMLPRDTINPDYTRPQRLSGQRLAPSLSCLCPSLMTWPFLWTSSGSVEVILGHSVPGLMEVNMGLLSRSLSLLPPTIVISGCPPSPQREELHPVKRRGRSLGCRGRHTRPWLTQCRNENCKGLAQPHCWQRPAASQG